MDANEMDGGGQIQMGEWIDGWMDGQMDTWMDGSIAVDGRATRRMSGGIDEWLNG